MRRVNILGVEISAVNKETAIQYLLENMDKARGKYICACNVHTTVTAHENLDYQAVQNNSFMTLPDGKPLSSVGVRRGYSEMGRVTGPDFMEQVIAATEKSDARHYFYGTTQKNLNALLEYLKANYPQLSIVGCEPSLFRPLTIQEETELCDRINESKADFVWVALGAPRQEKFCAKLSKNTKAVWIAVGGAFNVISGVIPRAPQWIQDEWFSDDLKKLDDDKVFAKLQDHWIIEMSEMLATSNAKSIEEIRSFISRQKETYRTPYETQPKDRLRQCVFGGSSNTLDFLPLDRAGNRRFLPVMIYPEKAEVHILEDEAASREYLLQVWAEAMTIYRSGEYSMKFSKEIQRQLVEVQKDFMPEDTEAGQIQGFLEHYTGNVVCSKQLFKEALGHAFEEPKRWQLHNINEIMNTVVRGWKPFSNPRMFAGYGRQRGWEREISGNEPPDNEGGFVELSEEEVRQLELPKEWIA